jgi:hypothetical protein
MNHFLNTLRQHNLRYYIYSRQMNNTEELFCMNNQRRTYAITEHVNIQLPGTVLFDFSN